MKKIFLLSISIFAAILLKANPVSPTQFLITELYFDNNDKWTMELLIKDPIYNLNTFKLVTSSGEAQFKLGINVCQNGIILITSDSMQNPLTINRLGDYIEVQRYHTAGYWTTTNIPLRFGNIANSFFSYPKNGQTIELLDIDVSHLNLTNFVYVKSNTPSLGSFTNNAINCMGNFNGFVFDNSSNPIPFDSIRFIYSPKTNIFSDVIFSDAAGHFNQDMYARNYNIRIYYPKLSSIPYMDTIISIEPDSTVSCVFHINNYISCVHDLNAFKSASISNYPNPFKTNATLIIKVPSSTDYTKAIIKFFNNFGEIVKIIPVEGLNKNTETYHISLSVNDNFKFSSGTYYYVLEVNGEKMASNKMTLIK